MKTIFLILTLFTFNLMCCQTTLGISDNANFLLDWTNFKPKTAEYKKPNEILSGVIASDKKLFRNKTYLLSGIVYVTNKAKLSIESGTVIRGDFDSCGTLVITKGASIFAEGEATSPIVFTSNKDVMERNPGDWGGIIILGDAPINRLGGLGLLSFDLDPMVSAYGGDNEGGSAGVMRFVRIEFPGRKLNASKEFNGLSLAGVGNKTKIENIQVSFSNDDSFESYGGNLLLNNLVSYRATDDDFDFTQGVQCAITNCLAIRYPYSSDVSTSRCFEIDTYDKPESNDYTRKQTTVAASNITLVNNEENTEGLVKEAIYISEKCNFSLKQSVVSGFSKFILLNKKIEDVTNNLNKIILSDVIVNSCAAFVESENVIFNSAVNSYFLNNQNTIKISVSQNKLFFVECTNKNDFDFRIKNFGAISYK